MEGFFGGCAKVALSYFKTALKKAIILWLMGFVAMQVQNVSAIDADCNFNDTLVPGKTYYISSPGYPKLYTTPRECRWIVTTPDPGSKIRLTSGAVDLPCIDRCTTDNITVNVGNGIDRTYSGKQVIFEESMGNEMIITFSAKSKHRGRFMGALQVITPEDQNCTCGWTNPSRIVGGNETGINEFPMMVAIIYAGFSDVHCGGSVISEKLVLTAAHCMTGDDMSLYRIAVGEHDIRIENETTATNIYDIESVEIHPEYRSAGDDYDVALVTVTESFQFDQRVGPICLPFYHLDDGLAGSLVTILGWGTTQFAGPKSPTLQKATVSVVPTPICNQFYSDVTGKQLCTYANGRDACQFDSGGPVIWKDPTTLNNILVGVISSGYGCATSVPGLNQRVGAYTNWIINSTSYTGTKFCAKY